MFSSKTDLCKLNYCQDGIIIRHFESEMKIFVTGHYEIHPIEVNGRPYFIRYRQYGSNYGIWWSNGYWFIGPVRNKGQSKGYVRYKTDDYCPHQLIQHDSWNEWTTQGWITTQLVLHCKYNKLKV